MRLSVYLDTSVFSAYFDERTPDRLDQTREFWAHRADFDLSTSEITSAEIAATPDPLRRGQLESLLPGITIHPLTDEMKELAVRYVDAGAFPPSMLDDARHVATAVLARCDVIVSWNFRHLVNRRRRAQVNLVNTLLALPTIDIVAPPEL